MNSGLVKTDKGCPKGAINDPCLCAGHLSATALARFSLAASGMPITMIIAESVAISISIFIIMVTVPLAPSAIVPGSVSALFVPTLAVVVALVIF